MYPNYQGDLGLPDPGPARKASVECTRKQARGIANEDTLLTRFLEVSFKTPLRFSGRIY